MRKFRQADKSRERLDRLTKIEKIQKLQRREHYASDRRSYIKKGT